MGAGLKGLHHAKALLVVGETTADLIVGSLNWSTSSKANAECGLRLTVASGAPVVSDFIRDFESMFSGGSALDDSRPPAPSGCGQQRPFWASDVDPVSACGRSLRGTVRSTARVHVWVGGCCLSRGLRQFTCAACAVNLFSFVLGN